MEFNESVKILLDKVNKVEKEEVSIGEAFGRVLASDLIAKEDVPNFNRSPLDGYCFNYEDTLEASENNPSILDVIEVTKGKYFSYRLYRESCTIVNNYIIKDIEKFGRDLNKCIIVDNITTKF
jgi:molybdopterin biosynthesis enzyme